MTLQTPNEFRMTKFTVSKYIELDAGHRVPSHGGKCRNLHGHRWKVEAVVSAPDLVPDDSGRPDSGMVVDYGDIKKALMAVIHDPYDHKLILWDRDPLVAPSSPSGLSTSNLFRAALDAEALLHGLVVVPCVPTSEGLARFWFRLLDPYIKRPLRLVALKVYETPSSVATYESLPVVVA